MFPTNCFPIGFEALSIEKKQYLGSRQKPMDGNVIGPGGEATTTVLLNECDMPV